MKPLTTPFRQPLRVALRSILCTGLALGVGLSFNLRPSPGDDGLSRLLKKAKLTSMPASTPTSGDLACPISNNGCEPGEVKQSSHMQEFSLGESTGFAFRENGSSVPSEVVPLPLGYGKVIYDPGQPINAWNPHSKADEYVYDGSDRESKVTVDQSWNVYGLDTEDTIGHFDTLDGRRLVTPSNRVAIYAPRFGAVRRVDGLFNARSRSQVGAMEEKTILARSEQTKLSSSAKQNLAVDRFEGQKRASGLRTRTRGVVSGNVTHLFGMRNGFQPYENLSLIRLGKFSDAESARLNLGVQSAKVWEDNLGLQVTTQKSQPVIVNDVLQSQQLVHIESGDNTAILNVTKVASKIAAETGETVEFTIRFDNLTGKPVGNVTIIDNLTRRLEYVADSAECSLEADFINQENDGGSLMLRWEITKPLAANSGGIIRFQCRVR